MNNLVRHAMVAATAGALALAVVAAGSCDPPARGTGHQANEGCVVLLVEETSPGAWLAPGRAAPANGAVFRDTGGHVSGAAGIDRGDRVAVVHVLRSPFGEGVSRTYPLARLPARAPVDSEVFVPGGSGQARAVDVVDERGRSVSPLVVREVVEGGTVRLSYGGEEFALAPGEVWGGRSADGRTTIRLCSLGVWGVDPRGGPPDATAHHREGAARGAGDGAPRSRRLPVLFVERVDLGTTGAVTPEPDRVAFRLDLDSGGLCVLYPEDLPRDDVELVVAYSRSALDVVVESRVVGLRPGREVELWGEGRPDGTLRLPSTPGETVSLVLGGEQVRLGEGGAWWCAWVPRGDRWRRLADIEALRAAYGAGEPCVRVNVVYCGWLDVTLDDRSASEWRSRARDAGGRR